MRQQIADRDRPPRRHDGAARIGAHGHRRMLEIGNKTAHRIIERELPFLDERHERDTGERFGLRSDPEDCVRSHPAVGLAIGPSEGALIHGLSVFEHQRYRASDLRAIHRSLQHGVESR